MNQEREKHNILYKLPDWLVILLLTALTSGAYFTGSYFTKNAAEIDKMKWQKIHDTIYKINYKDTCIAKSAKVIYKLAERSTHPNDHAIKNVNNGNNNGIIGDNAQVVVEGNSKMVLPENVKYAIIDSVKKFIEEKSLENNYIIGVRAMQGNQDSYDIGMEIIQLIKKAGYRIGNSPGFFQQSPPIKGIELSKDKNKIMFSVGFLK